MSSRLLIGLGLTVLFLANAPAATDVWCPHVTSTAGWKSTLSLYNAGDRPVPFVVTRYDAAGNTVGSPIAGEAPAKGWGVVAPEQLSGEGTAEVWASRDLLVKASYQSGDSPSVCEFFLGGGTDTAWALPNTVQPWMNYTGLAVVNTWPANVQIAVSAWKGGVQVGPDYFAGVPARGKFVRLANQLWPGLGYADFDTVVVRSTMAIPAPMVITGNLAGDRHLFFAARPDPLGVTHQAGDLADADPVVGNLRFVPAGAFTQGSPDSEPGRGVSETPFTHQLTRPLAVMQSEVTRQMWANLKALQPTLPNDPNNPAWGAEMNAPVQSLTWFEAVLFANLLSAQRGLLPCYYADAGFTQPLTAANYLAGPVYCNFTAGGFRLPTEGEWEYFCRAGTTTPFFVNEPNYGPGNCSTCAPSPTLDALSDAAWWCTNSLNKTHPVNAKLYNPWWINDVHGNVMEWCWDRYAVYPTGAVTDYSGPATGEYRLLRGGNWSGLASRCRSAFRYWNSPNLREGGIGFRLVRNYTDNAVSGLELWCDHVTATAGWKTTLSAYNATDSAVPFMVTRYDEAGNLVGAPILGSAPPRAWSNVTPAQLNGEGSARVTAGQNLLVKASYQSGDSPSVCEFFLARPRQADWVLPNAVRPWLDYSGLALVNPNGTAVSVSLEAWKNGAKIAPDVIATVPPLGKYVRLSSQIWAGVNYADFDTIIARASAPIPAPMVISGNLAGDRHLFFSAQSEPVIVQFEAGDLVAVDPIAGNLRYSGPGTFLQGSPAGEACGGGGQFLHTLTRDLAVMEMEVTRQAWAALKAVQPTLPADPSDPARSPGMNYPVQQVTWYEALLFANLLSAQRGLTPCYYADPGLLTPVSATNYTSAPLFFDPAANGFRLPTEGERERFCRAGTTTPFSIDEPNYGPQSCGSCSPSPALDALNSVAWWCGNLPEYSTHPVGAKLPNPWSLFDVHGNVSEWCWDWFYGTYPPGAVADYRGPATGESRCLRGGGWGSYGAVGCTSASRSLYDPGFRDATFGFRLVRSLN